MGYHVMDLFYEHLSGVKDFDEFLNKVKTLSKDLPYSDLMLDFISVCVRRMGEGSGDSFLSVVHDILMREYDDAEISIKQGKETTTIKFAE